MFSKQDFESLAETFAAARSYIVNNQPGDRNALVGILAFETELKQKMIDCAPSTEKVEVEAQGDKASN